MLVSMMMMVMRRRVMMMLSAFRVVVVLVRVMRRVGMVAIVRVGVGVGVIIARHRSSKAGMEVLPGFLRVQGE